MGKEIVVASLYWFGYELTVTTETESEAETILLNEFCRAYKKTYGYPPNKEEVDERATCIEYHHAEFGKVEWR